MRPETKQGGTSGAGRGKRKRSQSSQIENFVKDTAKKTGKARSTVARDITRANKVRVLDAADRANKAASVQGQRTDIVSNKDIDAHEVKRTKGGLVLSDAPNGQPKDADDPVQCPRCSSSQVCAERRGYNLITGFFGSNAMVLTCLKCGYQFRPGRFTFKDWAVLVFVLVGLRYSQIATEQLCRTTCGAKNAALRNFQFRHAGHQINNMKCSFESRQLGRTGPGLVNPLAMVDRPSPIGAIGFLPQRIWYVLVSPKGHGTHSTATNETAGQRQSPISKPRPEGAWAGFSADRERWALYLSAKLSML